jgi:hypothetical protein
MIAEVVVNPTTIMIMTMTTDCHDITEILLKVALNTINQTKSSIVCDERWLLVLDSSGIILTLFFIKKRIKYMYLDLSQVSV